MTFRVPGMLQYLRSLSDSVTKTFGELNATVVLILTLWNVRTTFYFVRCFIDKAKNDVLKCFPCHRFDGNTSGVFVVLKRLCNASPEDTIANDFLLSQMSE